MQPFVERTTRDNQFQSREKPITYVTYLAPLTRALHLFVGRRHPSPAFSPVNKSEAAFS